MIYRHSSHTLAPVEGQSDTEEEISIQGDSEAETDEIEGGPSAPSAAPNGPLELDVRMPPTDRESTQQPTSPHTPRRAANVAASRGLQVATDAQVNKRHSRQVGLPLSPRPPQASPSSRQTGSSPSTPRI